MSELRFLPAAVALWLALIAVAQGQPLLAWVIGVVACALAGGLRERGQAVLIGGITVAGLLRAWLWQPATNVVTGQPRQTKQGNWAIPMGPETRFVREPPPGLQVGSTFDGQEFHPPTGWAGLAAEITARFSAVVVDTVGPSARGLLPGMVLGDTSLQSPAERDLYIATGLSHLSAVSGSNISLVTTTMFMLLRWAGRSPTTQVVGALAAMVLFVALVGPEPSVLRASVAGLVGLAAVVASSRMQPAHALNLGVCVLLIVRPSLATDFGFALSVAATAGIVALHPLIYRGLAPLRLPEVLARALAVTIAADAATMPIVALMTGQISLVSVLANIVVAPATAPVTLLGLLAVLASTAGLTWVAAALLHVAEPFAWWIHAVAQWFASLPLTGVKASPLPVIIAYSWVLVGITSRRPHSTKLTVAACIGVLLTVGWKP